MGFVVVFETGIVVEAVFAVVAGVEVVVGAEVEIAAVSVVVIAVVEADPGEVSEQQVEKQEVGSGEGQK